jgi:hypothetical protein
MPKPFLKFLLCGVQEGRKIAEASNKEAIPYGGIALVRDGFQAASALLI